MKKISAAIGGAFFFLICGIATSYGQFSNYHISVKYMDSLEKTIRANLCENIIIYPGKYDRKKTDKDIKLLLLVSKLWGAGYLPSRIEKDLKKFKKLSSHKRSFNGLIKADEIGLGGHYIRMKLILESVDDSIYRKHLELNTNIDARCGAARMRIFHFDVVTRFFASYLPQAVWYENNALVAEEKNLASLIVVSAKHPDYIFNLPYPVGAESDLGELFANQFDNSYFQYEHKKLNNALLTLIKANRTEVIESLLFSPNYLVSIEAMESLIYLKSINKFVVTQKVLDKFEEIRNANFALLVQRSPDAYVVAYGYKGLSKSEEEIINKISTALKINRKK